MTRVQRIAAGPATLLGQASLVALIFLILEVTFAVSAGNTVLQSGLVNEIPLKQPVLDQWRDGIFPLWSSDVGTGQPLLADSTSLPLDPRNLLFLPFSTLDGYFVAAIGTRVLAGVITFAYLRQRLGVSGFPAFIGAVLFLSSTSLFEEGMALANGIVAFPALLWLSERLLESITTRRVIALGSAWGLFLFMHSVAYLPYLMVGAFSWCVLNALFSGLDSTRIVRFTGAFAVAGAIGAGLAAINLLPAAELASLSNRGGEYPTDPFALQSLISAFIGANRPFGAFPIPAYYFYVGIASFAPILVAFKRQRDPYVRAALALGLGTAVLLLVGFAAKPLLVDLSSSFASAALFRPAFFIGFAAAVLVTYGLDEPDWRLSHAARRALGGLLLIQVSLLVALAVLGVVLITTRVEMETAYEPLRVLLAALYPGILPLLLIGMRAAGLSAALVQPSQETKTKLRGLRLKRSFVVGMLVLAELTLAWGIARPTTIISYGPSPELSFLKAHTSPDFRAMAILARPEWSDQLGPDNLSLQTNVPAYERIPTANAYSSLISSDLSETFDDFGDLEFRRAVFKRAPNARMETSQYDSPLLRALGVDYLYSTARFPDPRNSLPTLTGTGHYVYELKAPLPRAYFAGRAHWLPHDELHRQLRVVAEERPERIKLGPEILLEGSERTEGKATYAPARVTSDRGSSVEVSLTAPTAGFLVLSDLDLPGWSATVDGRPTPIYKANGFARAVRVPAGIHTVDFEYSPAGFRRGAIASGVTAVLCLAVLFGSILGARIRKRYGARK